MLVNLSVTDLGDLSSFGPPRRYRRHYLKSQKLSYASAFIHYRTVIFAVGRLLEQIVALMQIHVRYFAVIVLGGKRPRSKVPLIACLLIRFEDR